jgi:hypothetical protein
MMDTSSHIPTACEPTDAHGFDGATAMRLAVNHAVAGLDVGLPAGGRTAQRWSTLYDLALGNVSLARLCEAHLDALAVLAEADRRPQEGALYGVWASVRPDGRDVRLTDGRLWGMKSFCSGIGIVDRALMEVHVDGGRQLVDVDVRFVREGHEWRSTTSPSRARIEWHHRGLASCNTGTVELADVADVEPVGPPGWYLDRVGFWHGACGPAACWAGGAAGLQSHARAGGDEPFRLAAIGELVATIWTMRAVLRQAGDETDREPFDGDAARRRGLMVRHAIHELATTILDRFARAWGPRPLVTTPAVSQRVADVEIYLRQHHGDEDLVELARSSAQGGAPS